jgi:cyclophilin family peptidyl-prolyl cis-trans isomerase
MNRKYFFSAIIAFIAATSVSCQTKPSDNKDVATVTTEETTTPEVSIKTPEKMLIISTDYGTIKVKLYNETPLHRDNFIKLVSEKFYDGLLFHRVINAFMIQGGDPDSRNAKPGQALGNGGPGYTIPAEFVPQYYHKKGALAAARLSDQMNPRKESSGSQFYIVQGKVFTIEELDFLQSRTGVVYTPEQKAAYTTIGGTPHLDGAYTVFGEVVEGFEVIDKIAVLQGDASSRPHTDVKMTIRIIE